MRMKINLSQSDLEKLYVLLDNKEINISIAEVLFSIYEEKEFFRGCQTQEEFFQKRGYELIGDPKIVGEFDLDLWSLGDARYEEYMQWKERVQKLME